jgi:phage/plasmid-like protein (TIGR03299 family)
MTSAVEKMAYAGETPWHGVGHKVTDNLTPDQMAKAAGIDWTVSKRKIMLADGNGEIPGRFALCRDTDHKCLSIVGSTYRPVQNPSAMDFFSKFVKAGHMKMETAGSLWEGRYIWGLARIGKDFSIGKADEVRGYVLLCSPHVLGKAMLLQCTPIRVVCWNTLCMALGSSLKGKGNAFRMPHTTEFSDAVKADAELALKLVTEQMVEFKDAATLLSMIRPRKSFSVTFSSSIPKRRQRRKTRKSRFLGCSPSFRKRYRRPPVLNWRVLLARFGEHSTL